MTFESKSAIFALTRQVFRFLWMRTALRFNRGNPDYYKNNQTGFNRFPTNNDSRQLPISIADIN